MFGQADARKELALGNPRQIALTLLLASIAHDQRPGLAVGNPVRADRGSRRQQFLDHHIAFERMPIAAAITRRQGHPDIARGAERAAEIGIEARPAICARNDVALRLVHREPVSQPGTQCRNVAGWIEGIERKALHVPSAMQ